jgi:hypothetical protein
MRPGCKWSKQDRGRQLPGADDKLSSTWLVTRINHKLASSGSVITRTQGQREALGRYQRLDVGSGRLSYLSWDEVINLARELGLLGSPDSKGPSLKP